MILSLGYVYYLLYTEKKQEEKIVMVVPFFFVQICLWILFDHPGLANYLDVGQISYCL